jgi:hypothetical protein
LAGQCSISHVLGLFGRHPRNARAAIPLVPVCSWPFESTGQGITNVATPDANATYWVMPIDTNLWSAMIIQGTYPAARFFNFSTYGASGSLIDTVYDSHIAPDPGSTNPFATTPATGSHSYTVTVGTGSSGSSTLLSTGGSRLVFVVIRVYLPDQGLDRTGGVGLPAVSLISPSGTVRKLRPCPFANAEISLGSMITLLVASGFNDAANFLQNILTASNQRSAMTGSCNPGQPGPAPVNFGPAPGQNFFPNPQTSYLQTPSFCFRTGKILVVRGKALVFPDTYPGGSVFQPAFDGPIQVRYWSMCNNDNVIPYPVIGCEADFATKLDQNLFYTYVISDDPAPPAWLPADATWLPWGATSIPQSLIFRNILLENSPLAGDYYPTGVFCDQAVFMAQGWQGCFTAAGIAVAPTP